MENKKIAVLGAGMVGRAIALDLEKNFTVSVFDVNEQNLDIVRHKSTSLVVRKLDLLKNLDSFETIFSEYDILVLAVPGFMGYRCLEAAIKCKKPIADISFFPEDSMGLDSLAKDMGVPVIVDCGVAPGMSNLILGRFDLEMEVKNFECYVGGLPKERKFPWEYKAPFSPIDVIEEYLRPSRMIENGKIITKDALTDKEFINFDRVGTLEAFNTDGLRSLIYYFPDIPNMKEKTLRYPGYVDKIILLKEMGLLSENKLKIGESEISPLEMTSKILIDQWKLDEEEEEFTIMRVNIDGLKDGEVKRVVFDLYDEYDKETQTSSMARTTAYTCTAMVNILANEWMAGSGIFPPEVIGMNSDFFHFVLDHLAERGVHWKRSQ